MLNRFTFGPRPGDVEAVEAQGPERWFEVQLQPESIPDGNAESRLAALPSIRMSPAELIVNYPPNQVLKQIEEGKQAMPGDPQLAAVYATLIDRKQEQQKLKAMTVPTDAEGEQQQSSQKQQAAWIAVPLLLKPPPDRYSAILALPVADRRILLEHLRGDLRDRLFDGLNPAQRETLAVMQYGSGVSETELQEAKLLRAVYSERQVLEVMTDFWFNHFNVFLDKGADKYYTGAYERDVIRKHALGKFKDLLLAVAQSPAMLVYLDNASSTGPKSPAGIRNQRGLNENYGRELLELHTLGVNGGYSQQDVTEAARVLTGWTVNRAEAGEYVFMPRRHEPGDKRVLGRVYRNDRDPQQEGIDLLKDLAHRPATARFICTKLARRFVADDPPPQIVEEMARTFEGSDGNIRVVLRTMVRSPYFWSREAYRAKFKTPFEFVASVMRATGAEITNAQPLTAEIGRMGMPLYRMQTPQGYSALSSDWLASNSLLERLNFAMKFTSNGFGMGYDGRDTLAIALIRRTSQDPTLQAGGKNATVAVLEQTVLGPDVSPQTRNAVNTGSNESTDTDAKAFLNGIIGLLIGSPDFQHR